MDQSTFARHLITNVISELERAIHIIWYFQYYEVSPEIRLDDVFGFFESHSISHPNKSRLGSKLKKDRRTLVQKNTGTLKLRAASLGKLSEELIPQLGMSETIRESEIIDVDQIELPSNLDTATIDDLKVMIRLYSKLYIVENSIRKLIETILRKKLGVDWWAIAASNSMKRKHADRLDKEKKKKWVPARSDVGPLYSIDWPDLITLMRKYESYFLPYIGEINFMHRFDDAGSFRNVVAHNGVIDDEDATNLISIYLRDWIKQLGRGH